MMIGYLLLADELNAQIKEKKLDAKIYVWTNRLDRKLHGVELYINGKFEDIAENIGRNKMKPAVRKAYERALKAAWVEK